MPELQPPACPVCKDARFLRGPGPMGTAIPCHVCAPAPAEVPPLDRAKRLAGDPELGLFDAR